MFLFLPIRSEKSLKRFSYVTVGLIVLNVVIWIITNVTLSHQQKEIESIQKRIAEIGTKYIHEIVRDNPDLLNETDFDRFYEELREFIPRQSQDYYELNDLYERYQFQNSNSIFRRWGFIPKTPDFIKIFTAMFLHLNLWHLLGNMLFLWVVGCNMEDDMGWKEFLLVYALSGIFAAIFHMLANASSLVPCIGASGAVAGIMGAFMVRRYNTKIRFLYFIWFFFRPYFGTIPVRAYLVLPFWFIQQLFGASWSGGSGVAYWAHIGGFVFGACVSFIFRATGLVEHVEYFNDDEERKFSADKVFSKLNESIDSKSLDEIQSLILTLTKTVNQQPSNIEAWISLARAYMKSHHEQDGVHAFNTAIHLIVNDEDQYIQQLLNIYYEFKERQCLRQTSKDNIIKLARIFEKHNKFKEAVHLFALYIKLFPNGSDRRYSICRVYLIFKNKLQNVDMARRAFELLRKDYPEYFKKSAYLNKAGS